MDFSFLQRGVLLPEFFYTGSLLVCLVLSLFDKATWVKWFSVFSHLIVLVLLWNQREVAETVAYNTLTLSPFFTSFKLLVALGGLLVLLMTDSSYKSEFYLFIHFLILSSFFVLMSRHAALLVLSLEGMSIAGYWLVGASRHRAAAEGSMKYFLFGAAGTATLLYGLSLMCSSTHTFYLENVSTTDLYWLVGLSLFSVGLFFKIAAFPFHGWAPDVYEAAPLPVLAILSTVSKITGLVVLHTLLLRFATPFLSLLIATVAALSLLVGNLGALFQTNVKRLLAWSSIAQAGFMLLAVLEGKSGEEVLFFYAAVFLLSNFLVVFAIEKINTQTLSSFSNTTEFSSSISLTIGLLSLAGIPFTSGFLAKFYLFTSFWQFNFSFPSVKTILWSIGLVSTLPALFFYVKIPYYLFIKKQDKKWTTSFSLYSLLLLGLSALVILLFVFPSWLRLF